MGITETPSTKVVRTEKRLGEEGRSTRRFSHKWVSNNSSVTPYHLSRLKSPVKKLNDKTRPTDVKSFVDPGQTVTGSHEPPHSVGISVGSVGEKRQFLLPRSQGSGANPKTQVVNNHRFESVQWTENFGVKGVGILNLLSLLMVYSTSRLISSVRDVTRILSRTVDH